MDAESLKSLGWLLLWGGLFYLMMRYGCGAHMMGGHGGHNHGGHGNAAPGGDVKLRPTGAGDMTGMDQVSPADLIGNLEGEFEAAYAGLRQEDGLSVGVIKLKLSAKAAQDMTDKVEKMKESLPEGVAVDITAFDGEYEYEAEGELLWHVESGMPYSLYLSGEVRMLIDISMTIQGSQNMEQSLTLSGNQTITLTTGT